MKNTLRGTRNTILFTILAYNLLLRQLDVYCLGDILSVTDWLFLLAFVGLIILHVFEPFSIIEDYAADTSLYLLYSSMLSSKLTLVYFLPRALILVEWIWLAMGILGVFAFWLIHLMEKKKEVFG